MKIIADISYGKNDANKLDIYLPDADTFDTFVYFHGGGLEHGERNGETEQLAGSYLAKQGIAFVSVDYRMYPSAKYPDFIEDAAEATAWIFNHIGEYGKSNSIFVGGSSAGAYLSMMLCFDKKYLAKHGILTTDIKGYFHDSGQPTCHFNVLQERGIDSRRAVIDESAPLYHIGTAEKYSPMMFLVADNDMECRYEQTMLTLATLKHFGYDMSLVSHRVMHGAHCQHCHETDANGDSILGKIIEEFIKKYR